MKKHKFLATEIPELLLQEAIEALGLGLKYYDEYRSNNNDIKLAKQSILNFHRFIEYTLKFTISKINPLLVFEKVFDKEIKFEEEFSTISFKKSLNFHINNINHGLAEIPDGFKKIKYKSTISCFKNLRNDIMHWFIFPNDLSELDSNLESILELIYFTYESEGISKKIDSLLNNESLDILDQIINLQETKLNVAIKKVTEYKTSRTNPHPRDYDPNDAPIFMCPQCGNETFILTSDDTKFQCTFCQTEELAEECSVSIACAIGKIPECYLQSWNKEVNSMICEECNDHINYLIEKND